MAVTDHSFNGSYATLGSVRVNPLTEFRHTNQPATVKQTGSTDSFHSYSVGRNNQTITLGFLGSRSPDAGTIADLAVTLSSSQETLSISPVVITNLNISGRKDAEIRSSITLRPSPTASVATITGASRANVGFNGTVCVAMGTTFGAGPNSIISLTYSAQCAEIDVSGADDSDVLISAGLPDRTVTVEAMGGPVGAVAKGSTGSITCAWGDGGTLGTFSGICTSVEPGGSLDDAVTTSYSFKQIPAVST